jgi:small-conductance mechanosensitive channel
MALLADTSKGTVYRPGKGWVKGLPYSEADYIWSRNVLRRHLTADQRAALAHKWADAERQTAKERQKQHGGTAPGRPGNTPVESNKSVREALAEKAQVSTHKIQQTEVLAKKAPELLPRVAAGEMKLKEAVKKLNEGLFNPEKRQTETASKPKEPRAQKDDGDAVAIAVNGAIKQIEKYIREVRRSVRANQHATYDTAVAARLEVLAKQLRGRTPNQTIDLTIDEDRSKFP